MKKIITSFCIAALSAPAFSSVNGVESNKQYSWMVSLLGKDNDLKYKRYDKDPEAAKERHFCGGMLIDQSWVLTAAHCVDDKGPGSFSVAIGATDLVEEHKKQELYIREVDRVVLHPRYFGDDSVWRRVSLYENDIALLRLKDHVDTNKVTPITITNQSAPVGTEAKVTGWGATSYSDFEFTNFEYKGIIAPLIYDGGPDKAPAKRKDIAVKVKDVSLCQPQELSNFRESIDTPEKIQEWSINFANVRHIKLLMEEEKLKLMKQIEALEELNISQSTSSINIENSSTSITDFSRYYELQNKLKTLNTFYDIVEITYDVLDPGPQATTTLNEDIDNARNQLVSSNMMICTKPSVSNHAHPESGVCNGDSGGPLFTEIDGKETLIGLVSWSQKGCGNKDANDIFTNVYEYKDWIASTIKAHQAY